MKGAPRSEQFDDIYFSAEDGLAETEHVFLKGNNLPEAWEGKESFVIAETGFGTGLNFLSAWKLFEETAQYSQTLDFISIEKYPLTPDRIKDALEEWSDYFDERLDILCSHYPIRIAGFHRIKINSQITLTLVFDDIAEALPQIDAKVDCWFLDGFMPSKNPDMWSSIVFEEMARLSKIDASYATFTAAGNVRRGLELFGFSVEKQKGFGRKRDMISGKFLQKKSPSKLKVPKTIAIIGGGLAGTSCAYVLKQYGFTPVIYEASSSLASGASGNTLGLYNPRFSKVRDDLSDFFAPAYAQLIRLAKMAGNQINYDPCGALHLMTSDDKAVRYKSMAQNWMWHEDHIKVLNEMQASEVSGINIEYEALYLPDSGSVSPEKLCAYYAQNCEVHLSTKISDFSTIEADAIILANGPAVNQFKELEWLEIDKVRGQVSVLQATQKSQSLKCNLCYGGYISANNGEGHMTGSTFEKWVDHTEVTDKDHQANIKTLQDYIFYLENEEFTVISGRAGMRAATNDRFPVVGAVPDTDNIYVSAAFGSHGLVGTLAGAHYLADLLRRGPKSLSYKSSKALNPKRFLDRARKRGRIN